MQNIKQTKSIAASKSESLIGTGVGDVKYNKVGLETKLRLEMAAIKEEDNSVFKGLGKNHDKSFTRQVKGTVDKSPSNAFETEKSSGVQDCLRSYKPVLKDKNTKQNEALPSSGVVQTTKACSKDTFSPYFVSNL